MKKPRTAIAIHGGAGTISRDRLKPRMEARYRAALRDALAAGHEVLARDGTSLDAVTTAVVALEDCPLFNAGRGAVFNGAGNHELDAAVMDGSDRRAGAVTGVRTTRNPVLAARAVMEKTRHVMLAGEAADSFAAEIGLAVVPRDYYATEERLRSLERTQRAERDARQSPISAADRHGTVGAVALDVAGNLAAGTSTGGFTNKMPGRVGDSPVIGAGTYADDGTCAVSGTGSGEHFMRAVLAHTVSARMRYLGESLTVAARKALREVEKLGGTGGLIAVDVKGRIAMPFNTEGMYRGCVSTAGEWIFEIYSD